MAYVNTLSPRLKKHALGIIQICRSLPTDAEFKVIKYQIIKSACSAGANYCESQSTGSKKDFIAKTRISLKEVSETTFWIDLLIDLQPQNRPQLSKLLEESKQLEKILGAIIRKASTNI